MSREKTRVSIGIKGEEPIEFDSIEDFTAATRKATRRIKNRRRGTMNPTPTETRQLVFDFAQAKRAAQAITEAERELAEAEERIAALDEQLAEDLDFEAAEDARERIKERRKILAEEDERLAELQAERQEALKRVRKTETYKERTAARKQRKALREALAIQTSELVRGLEGAGK